MRPARGFTLVELLVALFALALLAGLSWRGIDAMVRAQQQTQRNADDVLALQTGLAQWNADLDALVEFEGLTALDWNGRVLRLTRRDTVDVRRGAHVVGWSLREGQWRRWESPAFTTRGEIEAAWASADRWAQSPDDALRRQEVAVAPMQAWELFYFRENAWSHPLSSDDGQAVSGGVPPNPAVASEPAAVAGAGTPGDPKAPAAAGTQGGPGAQSDPGSQPSTRTRRILPDGVRLVLQLPPGQTLAGRLSWDWVRPTVGGGK